MVNTEARASVPMTAVVTAYRRVDQLLETLRRILACDPAPAEVRVHVDGGQTACADAVRQAFPSVTVIVSPSSVGPGGGRNALIAGARHTTVASFDDDAYPIDRDYFARLSSLFARFPEADILTARVFHQDEPIEADMPTAQWVADFTGGACAYAKEAFLRTGGYVPVPLAYGMEEVDLALKLHAAGGRILYSPWLRVFHDTDRARHAEPAVTAATISNIAVLTYLRYPVVLWGLGAAQVMNRVQWLIRHGRWRGVWTGLMQIGGQVERYRQYRDRLPARVISSYWRLRRQAVPAPWGHVQ